VNATERKTAAGVGCVRTQTAAIDLPVEGLQLECGRHLPELTVAYETYGDLSPARDNAVFLCHALTGSAHVAGRHEPPDDTPPWWDEMVGPGKGIDTRYYHVICANVLGGCKGTTGPSSIDPHTGKPYGSSFPPITVGDIVAVHRLLLRQLGIERLAGLIGGSFGGMQVLEWVIRYPDTVDRGICIASAASLSAQALAFDVVARHAITSDPNWQGGDYYGSGRVPGEGLAQARKIGHITYLSPGMMARKFGRERREADARGDLEPAAIGEGFRTNFQIESYLEHQGRKLVQRFDANSYLHITQAMDEYDLVERFGTLKKAFAPIRAKMLVVALSSDWLFPPSQSVDIANALLRCGKQVSYCRLHAPHGHDAFLVDVEHLAEAIRAFLPWVHTAARPRVAGGVTVPAAGAAGRPARPARDREQEYRTILRMIRPGSRVLDLGSGDGELLAFLARERSIRGIGVDIDIGNVIRIIDRGHDIFQADIDAGLAMIPDGMYDYAILSETLQEVRRPKLVLREMLRVAREGIVSFPNVGKWSSRLRLGFWGRMPEGGGEACVWYDTPTVHLFTLRDFTLLCLEEGISVEDRVCIACRGLGRLFCALGRHNLGADRVLVRICRRPR
jgi:homoserine O-acetyltransferase